jgi:tRNA(Ile)-lysidine synthase
VPEPGSYRWPAAGAVDIRVDDGGAAGDSADCSVFDGDRVGWPLVLRARRPGDRMRPRGGRGARRLSDLMIDAKIARGDRARLPVLTTPEGEILFVPGLRPAEAGRPTAATRRRLVVSFRPES